MQINLVWDSSVNTAPNEAAFKATVQAAANFIGNAIANPVSVTLQVGWGETGGTPIPTNAAATGAPSTTSGLSYSQLVNALTSSAQSNGLPQLASVLPANDPMAAFGTWEISPAEAMALGLGSLFSGTSVQGEIGFNASDNWSYGTTVGSSQYDLFAAAMHEITHALGRVSFYNTGVYDPLNLYTYAAPGQLQTTGSLPEYFSLDNGNTSLNAFDSVNDTADWGSGVSGDSFGSASPGVQGKLTFTDLLVMASLGFKMAPAYNLTGPTTVNPGSSITLTLQTLDVFPGTVANYSISGLSPDALLTGALNGTTTINANGTASITLGVASNVADTGSTSALVNVDNGQAYYTVTVGGSPFVPGFISSTQFSALNSGTANALSFNFSVDKLPANGTPYTWGLYFYGAQTGDMGLIGIDSNGYGNQSGGLGSSVSFDVWNAYSGTVGLHGSVNTYAGSNPTVQENLPFNFAANNPYTFTLTQSGNTISASVLNDVTGVSTQIGTIQAYTADNLLSGQMQTTSQVNTTVASAADIAPLTATWSNFVANGIAGISDGSSAPVYGATSTSNGVDYATILTSSGVSQFTGGAGNTTIALPNGDTTVWLGTQADTVVCGSSGNDIINCGSQNETILMGASSASIVGGGASTLVSFTGPMSNYTLQSNGSGYTVHDTSGTNGDANLQNVTFLKFSDKSLYVGPALTSSGGALTAEATVDALFVAVNAQAPGASLSATIQQNALSGTALANLLLTQSGLTNATSGLTAVFNHLGLSTTGDNGAATDPANGEAGLYQAMLYLIQNDPGIKAAGGLGFGVNWLVNALATMTSTNPVYAIYGGIAANLDTNIVAAHQYSSLAANSAPVSLATATVGIAGVLTQPFDQAV